MHTELKVLKPKVDINELRLFYIDLQTLHQDMKYVFEEKDEEGKLYKRAIGSEKKVYFKKDNLRNK